LGVEIFAFNFVRLDNILRERLEHSFVSQIEARCFHLPKQLALLMLRGSQGCIKGTFVPDQGRPAFLPSHVHIFLCNM